MYKKYVLKPPSFVQILKVLVFSEADWDSESKWMYRGLNEMCFPTLSNYSTGFSKTMYECFPHTFILVR